MKGVLEKYKMENRFGGLDEAAENPAMTAVTGEHAKPWKSFPASSKTFMEFSQQIQRHSERGGVEKQNSLTHALQPLFILCPTPLPEPSCSRLNRVLLPRSVGGNISDLLTQFFSACSF